ncbi:MULTISPECIES: carbohydrate ABC transporter permease [unclassified Rathayibacter]|uniref:carbohydrate ABC transporter permease n=1 Tax=unclassified Rathayibacter TaxID=2609250 RepID=UPI001FB2BB87|nr:MULTISPECIES: sugar ABC transporter permease [unclassified Rathayibacter]MCJ1674613.1 sugar ABC transporter permease [Rathayibacter sp. VKM Ac-2929]MCJ1684893.1 sugar ABC transporter permease [Rathayibacter sp. VKM Ac-2928]
MTTAIRPSVTGDPQRTRKRAGSARRRQSAVAWLFVSPFLLVFTGMLIAPLVYAGYLSLFETTLVGGQTFAGLNNYLRALQDPELIGSVGRVILFFVVQVPVMLGLAIILALVLDSRLARGSSVARLLIFLPYAVPAVVATLMWGYLYGPNFGPITQVTRFMGLGSPDLLSPENILGSMMNVVTWGFVGYNMIILYAALRAIPVELYEAAEIDGAGQFRIALSIKLPALRPALVLTLIFSVIGTFQLFTEPSLLNTIAIDAISNSFTPNYYAYNLAFINREPNYAAAIAFLLGLLIAVISFIIQSSSQRAERREGMAR